MNQNSQFARPSSRMTCLFASVWFLSLLLLASGDHSYAADDGNDYDVERDPSSENTARRRQLQRLFPRGDVSHLFSSQRQRQRQRQSHDDNDIMPMPFQRQRRADGSLFSSSGGRTNSRVKFTLMGERIRGSGGRAGGGGEEDHSKGHVEGIFAVAVERPKQIHRWDDRNRHDHQKETVQQTTTADSQEPFEMDVVEAIPSVTSQTTYSTHRDESGGQIRYSVKNKYSEGTASLLVAHPDSGDFAILSADLETDQLRGIAQKRGEGMVSIRRERQRVGPPSNLPVDAPAEEEEFETVTVVEDLEEVVPEDWECGTHDGDVEDFSDGREVTLVEDEVLLDDDGDYPRRRSVSETMAVVVDHHLLDGDGNHHHHHHHHHSHSHGHSREHTHANSHSHATRLRGKGGILSEVNHLIETLGGNTSTSTATHNINHDGIHQKRRKLYATDSFPQLYTYQVDLYIEIDDDFVSLHGTLGTSAALEAAVEYVNIIITAASSVFEREIDTHLHVAHIDHNNVYDSATSTSEALDIMTETYASDEGWHYTDGFGIDLHHAMLGNNLNGGKAYVGVICRSDGGFGVSTGMRGNAQNIAFWDVWVVLHEIGHNFGTKHTHDDTGYQPVVDTCGVSPIGSCSSQLPLDDSATIMSYCNLCPGNLRNILLTFGGYWYEDNRNRLENWRNSENLAGTVSFEPRRVPKIMWEHVSTRTCVEQNLEVPIVSCVEDRDCFDGNSCTVDTCLVLEGQCSNTMTTNCCGNFVCEANEGSCDDCGPFTLETSSCTSCFTPFGFMFDVEARESGISISSIYYRHFTGTVDVKIFTAPGNYASIQRDGSAWTQIGFQKITVDVISLSDDNRRSHDETGAQYLRVDFAPIDLDPNEVRAFYIHSTGRLLVQQIEADPIAADDYISIRNNGRYVGSDEFGAGQAGYACNKCSNKIADVASFQSTDKSAYKSAYKTSTRSPTSEPSLQPSNLSSLLPSSTPFFTLSVLRSASPSIIPSTHPSSSFGPSLQQSNSPSKLYSPTLLETSRPSTSLSPSVELSSNSSIKPSLGSSAYPSLHPSLAPISEPLIEPSSSSGPSSGGSNAPSESRSPTFLGTMSPSISQVPSTTPSTNPSRQPTSPSSSPSRQPSAETTANPSTQPSVTLSFEPSMEPSSSSVPTSGGSNAPSESRSPTFLVTVASQVPSASPSSSPSAKSSTNPSRQKSESPSIVPSKHQSTSPSLDPSTSLDPTSFSSNAPSQSSSPSFIETTTPSMSFDPTEIPSLTPSFQPSVGSSGNPSSEVTNQPSSNPSFVLIERPSLHPSFYPSTSLEPSETASNVPSESISPSFMGSMAPSKSLKPSPLSPETNPSMKPSVSPSLQPSGGPSFSISPSLIHSSTPTESFAPSTLPSIRPSTSTTPSTSPTEVVSNSPSSTPSITPSASPTPHPTSSPVDSSLEWYMNWKTFKCRSDGNQQFWQTMFDSAYNCCYVNLAPSPSLFQKCMPSPSPSTQNNSESSIFA
ncbi:hypothetical protein ACHAXS_010742 [Conticribra weissflogii]